jgi:hypothetical protein
VFDNRHDTPRYLTPADIADIRASGRDPEQVAHQLETLKRPRKSVQIIRPATPDDGIQQLQNYNPVLLRDLHEQAAAAGRMSSFIPASGSGTRLFHSLHHLFRKGEMDIDRLRALAAAGNADARDALVVLENITEFAIWEGLQEHGCSPGSCEQILRALFAEDGPQYRELPKGLVPFHRYNGFFRTAFTEHLNEAALLTTDRQRHCRIHFTISAAHRLRFVEEWQSQRAELERALNVLFQIDFSSQSSATDTIAVDLQGDVRRDHAGHILFQPGGHGALLGNLAECGGDVILIKNIDNVARQEHSIEIAEIRKQISGILLLVETQVHGAIRDLRKGHDPSEALELLQRQFGRTPSAPLRTEEDRRNYATTQLNRPLRVCGVIASVDHTGGRPFWMNVENFGPWLQIVESAEVDLANSREKELFHLSKHFNPVDIACSVRDVDGEPFDLNQFTTPGRALIARKTLAGIPSLLYEHPGLWNGAMALWNTVFVEIPEWTFNPVKSLSDLWTPRHREVIEAN